LVVASPKRSKRRKRARVEGEAPAHRNGRRARGGSAQSRRQDGGPLEPAGQSGLLDEQNPPAPTRVIPEGDQSQQWGYQAGISPPPPLHSPERQRDQAARQAFNKYGQALTRVRVHPIARISGLERGGKPKRGS